MWTGGHPWRPASRAVLRETFSYDPQSFDDLSPGRLILSYLFSSLLHLESSVTSSRLHRCVAPCLPKDYFNALSLQFLQGHPCGGVLHAIFTCHKASGPEKIVRSTKCLPGEQQDPDFNPGIQVFFVFLEKTEACCNGMHLESSAGEMETGFPGLPGQSD